MTDCSFLLFARNVYVDNNIGYCIHFCSFASACLFEWMMCSIDVLLVFGVVVVVYFSENKKTQNVLLLFYKSTAGTS